MRLSIAIATYNEEKNILRCLKSVYDWVDEIIIVDGTSTDKTVDVIKKFDQKKKIKIYLEDNPPMFHLNKQKAIEKCTKDWILQLDADEEATEDLRQEIAQLLNCPIAGKKSKNNRTIEQSNNRIIAFWIPRLNFFLGKPLKKGGQYPDYTLRLYRNGVAKFPCKSIHEQVNINVGVGRDRPEKRASHDSPLQNQSMEQSNNGTIGHLNSSLLHYPYPTFSEYLNKWNRYTSLESENLKKQGFKPSFFNFIKYFFILPKIWFFKTYFRHLGFFDGFPGFVFSLFSAIRYWGIYIKTIDKNTLKNKHVH